MPNNFFQGIGDFISGGVTALQPGRVQQMQAILDSEEGQKLLRESQILMNKARAEAMDRGEGLYGGRSFDPYVKGAEDLGKIEAAREKFVFRKLTPETAAYFDLAEKSVKDRMRRDGTIRKGDGLESLPKAGGAEYFKEVDQVDPIDRAIKVAGGRKTLPKADKVDRRDFFAPRGELDVFEEMGAPRLADYFQASTETVPEENIPRTYQQLGITNVDDMFILDKMQKALPDRDMKLEYENDPESMQRLIQLWRARMIDKSNLHKFFSAIQQKARQALGIA